MEDSSLAFGDLLNGYNSGSSVEPFDFNQIPFDHSPAAAFLLPTTTTTYPIALPDDEEDLEAPSSDTESTASCSQCRERNPTAFPIRLTTLEPYLICKAHGWYWTDAVKAKNWAPEHESTIKEVLLEIKEISTLNKLGGTWIVVAGLAERTSIFVRIASVGDWVTTST